MLFFQLSESLAYRLRGQIEGQQTAAAAEPPPPPSPAPPPVAAIPQVPEPPRVPQIAPEPIVPAPVPEPPVVEGEWRVARVWCGGGANVVSWSFLPHTNRGSSFPLFVKPSALLHPSLQHMTVGLTDD